MLESCQQGQAGEISVYIRVYIRSLSSLRLCQFTIRLGARQFTKANAMANPAIAGPNECLVGRTSLPADASARPRWRDALQSHPFRLEQLQKPTKKNGGNILILSLFVFIHFQKHSESYMLIPFVVQLLNHHLIVYDVFYFALFYIIFVDVKKVTCSLVTYPFWLLCPPVALLMASSSWRLRCASYSAASNVTCEAW